MRIYDTTDPRAPAERGHLFFAGVVNDLEISWPFLYAALGEAGVVIADVSFAESPRVVAEIANAVSAFRLTVRDSLLLVAAREQGTLVFSNSDINHPRLLTRIQVSEKDALCFDVLLVNNRWTIAEGKAGWRYFDLSLPAAPKQLVRIVSDGWISSLTSKDSTIFSAYGSEQPAYGILVYQLSGFLPPQKLSDVYLGEYGWEGIRISHDAGILAVTSNSAGLVFIDVELPDSPKVIMQRYGGGEDIVNRSPYLYLASRYGVFVVLSLANLSQPETLAQVFTGNFLSFVGSHGHRIFASHQYYDKLDILTEFQIDPQNGELKFVDTSQVSVLRFAMRGDKAFLSPAGVVLDISLPGNTRRLGIVPVPRESAAPFIRAMSWVSGTLLVAMLDGQHKGDQGGFEMFSLADPSRPRLLDLWKATGPIYSLAVEVRDTLAYLVSFQRPTLQSRNQQRHRHRHGSRRNSLLRHLRQRDHQNHEGVGLQCFDPWHLL